MKHTALAGVHSEIGRATVARLDGRFKAFGQARTLRIGTFESIDHDVDRVSRHRLSEYLLRHIVERVRFAVEQKTQKAALGELLAHFGKRDSSGNL